MSLPAPVEPYTDIYFLRSRQILQQLQLNPFVRAQVFFRQGPGQVAGLDEVVELLRSHSQLHEHGGRIFALPENAPYQPNETVLLIEAPAQDILHLETILLGVLSAQTTKANDHHGVDLQQVTRRVREIVQAVGDRPVLYFGARHWRYDEDATISAAALLGGAAGASTAVGAAAIGKQAIGTIPHSLENIFAWKYGAARAVVEATKAFDQVIEPSVPRTALVDYANHEVDDALLTATELAANLTGLRVDTCGENIMQGAAEHGEHGDSPFWSGRGVTISGVANLRRKLDEAGFNHLKITLSSGFGELAKVHAFVAAEKELGVRLFDSLGVGNLFDARIATMDVVGVGDTLDTLQPIAKVGRQFRPNSELHRLDK